MNRLFLASIISLVCLDFVSAEETPKVTEFKEKIAKLRTQAAERQKQIELTFEQEAAKCKKELLDALEMQRIEAMKTDRLEDALNIRQLMTEFATLAVPLAPASQPEASEKPQNPPTKTAKQNGRKPPEFYAWKQGEKPTKMIHKDVGICFLTNIHGLNQPNSEMAGVYIGEDGFWYLRGATHQNTGFLSLQAASVRYDSFYPLNGKTETIDSDTKSK